MKYFFWHWDEPRGDEFDVWGTSDWYYEIHDDGAYSKVIQIYESGHALFYSKLHIEDKYGFLPEGEFGDCEYGEEPITYSYFQKLLNKTSFVNVSNVS